MKPITNPDEALMVLELAKRELGRAIRKGRNWQVTWRTLPNGQREITFVYDNQPPQSTGEINRDTATNHQRTYDGDEG